MHQNIQTVPDIKETNLREIRVIRLASWVIRVILLANRAILDIRKDRSDIQRENDSLETLDMQTNNLKILDIREANQQILVTQE